MAHHALKSAYRALTERLNRFPQGAPPSETLDKILRMLISEQEAALIARLPIKPFTAEKAARIWKKSLAETQKILDELAGRALLVDVERDDRSIYTLPPPMAGFFEFSMMRLRDDVDQRRLAELFYQYINVEEDFIKSLFTFGETQLGRTFVHEPALDEAMSLQVLDYERASHVIKEATHRAVGICYCRHKMAHLNRACSAPMDICMTFNSTAESLGKHGFARLVDVAEGLDLLQKAYDHDLVQFGENVRKRVNFICNCCGCCCEAMIAARRFAFLHPVHTTNFLPAPDETACNGCGKCVEVCPVQAAALVSAENPLQPHRKVARIDERICLGCGLCVRRCGKKALRLIARAQRVITPLDSAHRVVVMAVERGKLQDILFDNRVLWSHRALAAVAGVILRLPPLQRAMASRQFKSRWLEVLIQRWGD